MVVYLCTCVMLYAFLLQWDSGDVAVGAVEAVESSLNKRERPCSTSAGQVQDNGATRNSYSIRTLPSFLLYSTIQYRADCIKPV